MSIAYNVLGHNDDHLKRVWKVCSVLHLYIKNLGFCRIYESMKSWSLLCLNPSLEAMDWGGKH